MSCVVVGWEAQLEEKIQLEVWLLYPKTRQTLCLKHRHIGPLGETGHMFFATTTRGATIHQIAIYGLMWAALDSFGVVSCTSDSL